MTETTPTIRSVARAYARPDDAQAWRELAVTVPLYALAALVSYAYANTWWVVLPAMVAAAALALRIYMIQHDCLHRSFFGSRRVNDIVGSLLSPIAMTPYHATRYKHNLHHAHVSDIHRRDTFEIYVMTLAEWQAASTWQRLVYRVYRSPLTLIVIGPFLLYMVFRRFPSCTLKSGVWDVIGHNAMVAAYVYGVWAFAGWSGIFVWVGTVYIATVFGALIPYVVHNFEFVHWGAAPEMDNQTAALEGSSVLDWGPAFDVVMMNIGYHDLHHLNANIPGYRLKAAHSELHALDLIKSQKIGFWEGLGCLRWKLYDADNQRMVRFPKPTREAALAAE